MIASTLCRYCRNGSLTSNVRIRGVSVVSKDRLIAHKLCIPWIEAKEVPILPDMNPMEPGNLYASYNSSGYLQIANIANKGQPFRISYVSQAMRNRWLHRESEPLYKVFKGCDTIIDLTAGIGRDSFILADYNRKIFMFERSPVLAYLIKDAVSELSQKDASLAAGLFIHHLDSTVRDDKSQMPSIVHILEQIIPYPFQQKVGVYIDPMYPSGTVGRKSLVKKETQLLKMLANESDDNMPNDEALFNIARGLNPSKIAVKRPLHGNMIVAEPKPVSQVCGSTQRFDVYIQ
jgi:16S rRNA (guanine1516-N2)-methyltransferase